MKRICLLLGVMAALFASCEKMSVADTDTSMESGKKEITFNLSWSQQLVRSTLESENITDVYILDYINGELSQSVHKVSSDGDFSSPTLTLDYGVHELRFIATRAIGEISNGIYTTAKVLPTFTNATTLTIAAGSSKNVSVQLGRNVCNLQIVRTDNIPSNFKTLKVEFDDWYNSCNIYDDFYGSQSAEESRTLDLANNATGGTFYSFCPSGEEWTTKVTLTAFATDNSMISTVSIPDVTMKINRKTVLTGEFFGRSGGFGLSLNTEWDEDENLEF